ncbi:MAG: 2'-5' RNA ligase family protein [Limisphaerales bacterium]
MGNAVSDCRRIYGRLWDEAVSAFERSELDFDHHLRNKDKDLRRGLTLLFRPSSEVKAVIGKFLKQLADVAPQQYFYRPEEFHTTVLAIIPGSESWQEKFQHLPAYQAIIDNVLKKHRPFSIHFQGVTASRGGVMIQGFLGDDTLEKIRDDLREAMRQNNFGGQLDVRYKINAAHITVMRFREAEADWKRVLELLKVNRAANFGEARVENLELVLGDWYASANTARTIQKFSL